MLKKLGELQIELGATRNAARQIEQAAHALVERLDLAFKGVFQGLSKPG